jgi:hypothetical protein
VWATVLPVLTLPERESVSVPAAVELAQQEYDDRDDEVLAHAAEVRAEALRRLGRATDDDVPPTEVPASLELRDTEPKRHRKRGHRASIFRTRGRSEPEQAQHEQAQHEQAQHEHGDQMDDERQAEAADREADTLHETEWRPDADESPFAAERERPVEARATANDRDTAADAHDAKPVDTPTISERQLEPLQAQQEHDDQEREELQMEAAHREADALLRPDWRPDAAESSLAVERDTADAAPSADRPDTTVDAQDIEPTATPTSPDDHTPDTIAEPELPRQRRRRVPILRSRRNAEQMQPQDELDEQVHDEFQTDDPEAKVDVPSLPDADEPPPVADPEHTSDAPPAADRRDATPDPYEPEPVAAPASRDEHAVDASANAEPRRKRGQRVPAFRARRRSEPLEDHVTEEHLGTEPPQNIESSDGTSEINERLAQYALADRRRPTHDRRSFVDRRQGPVEGFDRSQERRIGGERRSGRDRRRVTS